MKEEIRGLKRERILDAALQLFYERGFTNTTVAAIAELIGVTKPFIYSYFENKDALLAALFEQAIAQMLELMDEAVANDNPPEKQLADFVDRFARYFIESKMIATVFSIEEKHLDEESARHIYKKHKIFDRKLSDLVRRGVEAGVFKTEDPAITALALTGMLAWIQRWYRAEGRFSGDEIARLMTELALSTVRYQPTGK